MLRNAHKILLLPFDANVSLNIIFTMINIYRHLSKGSE
ncbi:MAG: hypothetical protein OFPII_13130 [Osedax symbiont Rs1]|nr:MAG: hypothetical protein OFPII_13130 [Osedax symbiont Rs1]